MDVLLLGRGWWGVPNLGIGYLGSYLIYNGFSVEIAHLYENSFAKIVNSKQPRIVGISGLTIDMLRVYHVAKVVKEISPDSLLVVGGLHPTALPVQTLEECTAIDAVVTGEGEIALAEIAALKDLRKGLGGIAGTTYWDKNRIVPASKSSLRPNLDTLPNPLRSFGEGDFSKEIEEIGIHIARGCPYLCKGCSNYTVFGRKYRSRKPQKVVDEIEGLETKYSIRLYNLVDEIPEFEGRWLEEFCKTLTSRRDDIQFGCFLRIGALTDHIAKTLVDAGCTRVSFAVESGVEHLLKRYQAGYSLNNIRESFAIAKRSGLRIQSYFWVGCPGETEETANKTLDLISELEPDEWWLGIRTPIPGTSLYKEGIEQGLPLHNKWSDYDNNPLENRFHLPLVGTDLTTEYLQNLILEAEKRIPGKV